MLTHPVGRSINFDLIVNIFIMVVYENLFLVQSEFSAQKATKSILIDNHYKFMNQSELKDLPTGRNLVGIKSGECHYEISIALLLASSYKTFLGYERTKC